MFDPQFLFSSASKVKDVEETVCVHGSVLFAVRSTREPFVEANRRIDSFGDLYVAVE